MSIKKKTKTILFILLIVSFFITLVAHIVYPLEADDFFYSTNLVTGKPLSSIAEVWESQIWHYFNWGGRSIAHAILQVTLMLSHPIRNCLNVLVTILLLLILCKTADAKGTEYYFVAFSLLFGTVVAWKSCMFWQSGSANYLYMSCFVFLYFFLYLRVLRGQKDYPLMVLWMIPFGLIAGWSNENIGPTLWLLSVISIFLVYREKKKIPLWMITGSISCLAGSIILICAPGNYVRSAFSSDNELSLPMLLIERVINEGNGLFYAMIYAIIVSAFLLVIGKFVLHINIGRDRILYLLGSLFSWGALIMSPAFTDRAFWGPTLFLILFCLSYLKDIIEKREDLYLPLLCAVSVFWIRGIFFLCEHIKAFAYTLV